MNKEALADLREWNEWAFEYLVQLRFDPNLLRSSWERTELPFPTPVIKQSRLPASQ